LWLDTAVAGTHTFKVYDGAAWRVLWNLNTASGVISFPSANYVLKTGDTLTGALLLPDGSAALPAYSFSGDTNTGLWRSGADSLALVTGGAARLTVSPTATTSTLPVVLPADPTTALHAATKQYVDSVAAATDTAAEIGFTPAGGLAAVNVQAALVELDTEKVAKAGDTMSGDLSITKATPVLSLNTSTDVDYSNRSIRSFTGTKQRWDLQFGTGTESGSNAGGDIVWNRYADDGTTILQTQVLRVQRSTGNFRFGMNVAATVKFVVSTNSAADAVVASRGIRLVNQTTLDDSSTNVEFATNATNRAEILGQKETGANNGKLVLRTYLAAVGADVLTLGSNKRATFHGDTVAIATARTPASATATGTAGEICWDSGFVYVCVAANTWRRAALASW
jgi:hypothetical protein